MFNSAPEPDDDLIRFINCFLSDPETGDLTTCAASVWVDRRTGTIVGVDSNDPDAINCFLSDGGSVRPSDQVSLAPIATVDLDGQILAPGMIDIQINGAYGVDFSHWPGDEARYAQAVEVVSTRLVETGVTAYVPTVIVSDHPLEAERATTLTDLLTPDANT